MDKLLNIIDNNTILIIPNNIKDEVLGAIRKKDKRLNIKIYDLNSFIKKLTFDYDEKTIKYVMDKYNVNYNISKLYLDNIRYIDSDDNNFKIHNLFNIKKSAQDLLIKDNLVPKLIKNKKIIVYGYDYITRYQKHILESVDNVIYLEKEYNKYTHEVYKFNTLDDEVIFVAEEISKLLSKGIDINNIFISNIDDKYVLSIKSIFDKYNIPVNINIKNSLYETTIAKYFLDNLTNDIDNLLNKIENIFNLSDEYNKSIYNSIISVLNKFYFTNDYLSIKENICNVFKNTYLKNDTYNNAVNENNIKDNIISDDKYVFLLNFNLNSFPKTINNEDYINDDIKPEFLETSIELNLINKELYYKNICNVKNLIITFKEKYLNETFYPSILIDEYNIKCNDYCFKYSNYSDDINKIKYAIDLDNLIKYNIKEENLNLLYSNYKILYNTYSNKFSGINKDNLYKYLDYKFNLSYSSMDNYYHCAFRFYLANILKIDKYEVSFQTYIGNLFHYVLSKAFLKDFDFDKCVKFFIDNNSFENTNKNKYFLNKVLEELKFVIKTINYQNTLNDMNEVYYEKKININKKSIIDFNFKGFIDKLLKKDNYVVIIDYKTYIVDINLHYLPYGLSMQLPVYLYLTKNINKDYEIIGFYLQQVLFNKFNKEYGKTEKELRRNNIKLKGYSVGNENKISILDSTYENSELIHGMKMTSKGFSTYSKVLTNNQINNILKLTENKINECINEIENANFSINPKVINNKNIGCNFCKFKDVCFKTNKDLVELDNIKDLSFLD